MKKYNCTFHLNRTCNFDCSYCYVKHIRKDKLGNGVKKDLNAFNNLGISFNEIVLTGGEPFIYPDFVKLCKGLTDLGDLNIVTNLSTKNVYDFAKVIDPSKITEISVSLHIGQRKDYDSLIDRIKYLKKRGFKTVVSQVLHPSLFMMYKDYYRKFSDYNIAIHPKVFEGFIGVGEYPFSYKKSEKQTILDFADLSETLEGKGKYHWYSRMVDNTYNWKGRKCGFGYNGFIVYYNGDIVRCHSDKQFLGNIYDGAFVPFKKKKVCNFKYCKCASEGFIGNPKVKPFDCEETFGYMIEHYAKNYYLKLRSFLFD